MACGADGDDFERDAKVMFEAGDVVLGLGGQLVEVGDVVESVVPAGEGFVEGLGLGELQGVGGEPVCALALNVVVGADVEFVEGGEDIQKHEGGTGCAGDGDGVAQRDGVDPAAAARASRGGAVLVAAIADLCAGGIVEFGGEWSGADARGVGFDDAEGGVHSFGGQAGADAEACAAVGGGDVGDGAVIDIEEDGIGAFKEQSLFVFDGLMQKARGVGDEGAKLFPAGAVLFKHGSPVEGIGTVERFQDGVFFRDDALEFFSKACIVQNVRETDGGGAIGFVGIARANAAAGGADFAAAAWARRLGFGELVLEFVVGEDDIGVGGEFEIGFDADALGGEAIDFFEGFQGIDDDAVADDAGDRGAEDADGDEVEAVFGVADFDFVAGVGAAVPADGEVEISGEEVDNFALAFIAPLEADDGDIAQGAQRGGRRGRWWGGGGGGGHGAARLCKDCVRSRA